MFGTLTHTLTNLFLRAVLFGDATDPRNSIVAGGLLLLARGMLG